MTTIRIQQLHFAGSDAARFLKTLQDKAGTSVEIVSQTLLRDAEASRDAILVKLNETIAKAEPGDSILLFIAGHGVQTRQQELLSRYIGDAGGQYREHIAALERSLKRAGESAFAHRGLSRHLQQRRGGHGFLCHQ